MKPPLTRIKTVDALAAWDGHDEKEENNNADDVDEDRQYVKHVRGRDRAPHSRCCDMSETHNKD